MRRLPLPVNGSRRRETYRTGASNADETTGTAEAGVTDRVVVMSENCWTTYMTWKQDTGKVGEGDRVDRNQFK